MIGYYDYTVVLTYLSLVSAMLGILTSLHSFGHPFLGVFFLLISGLCDTFDGKVARSKKNRTGAERSFGIQIDSLADLVAFGVQPACIAIALVRASERYTDVPMLHPINGEKRVLYPILLVIIVIFYVLTALIRLAYFNVTEQERQTSEPGSRAYYTGLPVTSSALIFPTVMLIQFVTKRDVTIPFFIVMVITGVCFVAPFRVKKPNNRMIAFLLAIGAVEFVALFLLFKFILRIL